MRRRSYSPGRGLNDVICRRGYYVDTRFLVSDQVSGIRDLVSDTQNQILKYFGPSPRGSINKMASGNEALINSHFKLFQMLRTGALYCKAYSRRGQGFRDYKMTGLCNFSIFININIIILKILFRSPSPIMKSQPTPPPPQSRQTPPISQDSNLYAKQQKFALQVSNNN